MNTTTNSHARWLSILGLGFLCLGANTAQAQNIWTGEADTVYTRPSNWSLGRVPNSTDDVTIVPNGTSVARASGGTVTVSRQPSLSAALGIGQAGNITINSGAFLRLNPQSELDLFGNLTNNGRFSGAGALSTRTPASAPAGAIHVIAGNGNIITLNDLTIDTSEPAILGIPVRLNRLLSLTGNLTTTSVGTLTLLSTPAVTAFVDNTGGGVVFGSVTVQRAIDASMNQGLGYRHYSSPVSNTTVADLTTSNSGGNFTPVLNTVYNESATPPSTVPFPTVYGYDQARVNQINSSPNFDKGFFSPASTATTLTPGRGFTVNLNGAQLVDFVGTLNNGDIAVTVARNGANTLNSGDAGWVFLGNPYPSPIDYSRVAAADRSALESAIYVYSSTSQYNGMYRAYNVATGVGNPAIPVAQAFFARVAAAGTSSTFTFRNSQRLTTSDGTTFQRTASATRPQVEITLNGKGSAIKDYLNVYFDNASTAKFDATYDAEKISNTTGLNLNTLAADGQALAIDARPLPTGSLTVPLQVAVPTTGYYSLNLEKALNMNGMYAYLRDIKEGSLTDLSQKSTYAFTLSANNTTPRFELVFSPTPLDAIAPAALAQKISLYPNPANSKTFVELPADLGSQDVTATVVDGLGRTVRAVSMPAQGGEAHELSLEGLNSGIYTLRLNTSSGVVAKRLVVK